MDIRKGALVSARRIELQIVDFVLMKRSFEGEAGANRPQTKPQLALRWWNEGDD